MFIPFEQTKSLSMKLPVAPESRRALTEWSSLVSVVPISTGRRREVPHASDREELGQPLLPLGFMERSRDWRVGGRCIC